jgi:chromosome partitioning protein
MKIGVTNLKGGVGKSMISQNLAVCFAHMGYKVCIVDTDATRATEKWGAVRDESLPDILVVSVQESDGLNKTVKNLHSDYEVIIIDGTPSLSEMVTRIILVSDVLFIPMRPGASDFRTLNEFYERYDQAKEFRDAIPAYFILNEYNDNLNIHKGVKNVLQQEYDDIPILNTTIKNRVAYGESSTQGIGVYEYLDNKAKAEMVSLTNEVLALAEEVGLVKQ